MNWGVAGQFLGALIDLILLEKQLDLLELTRDAAYDLATRQVDLAEMIVLLHCLLLEKTPDYYEIANTAPIYLQQYQCAMDLANIDVIRESNRAMNDAIDTTDMYSSGLKREYIESAMGGVVFSSSGQWAMAYRNEDELNMVTDLRKYKHMVDSMNPSSLFTGHQTMSRLAQNTLDLAASTSRLVESHLTSFVTGVTDWAAGPSRDKGANLQIAGIVSNKQGDNATPFDTSSPSSQPITPQTDFRNRTDRITILPQERDIRAVPLNDSGDQDG